MASAKQTANNQICTYEANGEQVKLSPSIIRAYLVSGDAKKVTDQEVMMFLMLCKGQHLNPYLKEAHLVKYGDKPATMIVGKEVYTKRASKNPKCKGFEAGVIVLSRDGSRLQERTGTLVVRGETLVGGWCKVYVEGYEKPMYETVSFDEYNTGMALWKKMPATMIRKVALCHALREAFPEDFAGLYDSSEMGQSTNVDLDAVVDVPTMQEYREPRQETEATVTVEAEAVETVEAVNEDIPDGAADLREFVEVQAG